MNGLDGHEEDAAIIDNPFVKSKNKSWELRAPHSLNRSVSPPLRTRVKQETNATQTITPKSLGPTKSETAAVEAGEIEIDDHVSFFSAKLLAARLPVLVNQPRLTHQAWLDLYQRNLNDRGHHFVVHQHDHPIAGTHYDLRLQCNATSSISFAIMYGLPGDPNSRRLNRNATETRVHNLWNHLIETASSETGTMILWDTGEYSVLPYHAKQTSSQPASCTDTSDSDSEPEDPKDEESEPAKLHRAFQARKIKLRLHGTKLPPNYTISLRLTTDNFRSTQPPPPSFKRRRRNNKAAAAGPRRKMESSGSSRSPSPDESPNDEDHTEHQRSPRAAQLKQSVSSLSRLASPPARKRTVGAMVDKSDEKEQNHISPSARPPPPPSSSSPHPHPPQTPTRLPTTRPPIDPDEQIRLQNAYPGATNSINSIHQRKWFLSLDRPASGFTRTKDAKTGGAQTWRRPSGSGAASFEKFHVLGREHETSVLTGRKAADVARDEGLVGFRPRGGWVGITE